MPKTIIQLPAATGINVADIFLLRQAGADKQMSASGVCITTGEAQTVSGVKTFASIPILPGSDPTLDNQAVRKKYIDDNAPIISSGSGAPGTTPTKVGDIYIDTTGDRVYIAKGTSSSADWEKQGKYEYGTVTVTAGGGDVTVNLDWDWSDGMLFLVISDATTEYYNNAGVSALFVTYESLTNASYTTDHTIEMVGGGGNQTSDKSANSVANPKSATTKSFTLDDDGANTRYCKWMVIA